MSPIQSAQFPGILLDTVVMHYVSTSSESTPPAHVVALIALTNSRHLCLGDELHSMKRLGELLTLPPLSDFLEATIILRDFQIFVPRFPFCELRRLERIAPSRHIPSFPGVSVASSYAGWP